MNFMSRGKLKASSYQSALSITALVLIILMGLTALFVQQALRQSQELRQQAFTTKNN